MSMTSQSNSSTTRLNLPKADKSEFRQTPPLWRYSWLKLSYGVLTGMAIVLILGILNFS